MTYKINQKLNEIKDNVDVINKNFELLLVGNAMQNDDARFALYACQKQLNDWFADSDARIRRAFGMLQVEKV